MPGGSGNLINVADGYGRALVFTYYSGLIGDEAYKNGQLWRVGDQEANGLGSSSPAGRYVELDYTPERAMASACLRQSRCWPAYATCAGITGHMITTVNMGRTRTIGSTSSPGSVPEVDMDEIKRQIAQFCWKETHVF